MATFLGAAAGSFNTYGYSGLVSSITKPDGSVINYNWTWNGYCQQWTIVNRMPRCSVMNKAYRLSSLISSNGFQFTPTYSTDTFKSGTYNSAGNIPTWLNVTGVQAFNLANSSTTAVATQTISQTTSGTNILYSIGDPGGANYNYTAATVGFISVIQTPGVSSQNIKINYTSTAPRIVSSVINAAGTTTYASSTSSGVQTVIVTDAQSHVGTYAFDTSTGQMTSYTDPLGNKTAAVIDSYGRITKKTFPEGNFVVITYDARGNVTQQAQWSKPGSGLTPFYLTAGYDATCSNAVKCNQPNWAKDSLGNETDYTYDPTSGLLTSTTGPAAPNSVRPQTRLSYTQMQGYYLNQSGSVVASGVNTYKLSSISSCRTEAGATVNGTQGQGPFTLSGSAACLNTSDETRSTINYGPQSVGTANNIYAQSQTTTAGDGSVSSTTSQTYDNVGNIVTSVGPLGSGQTSYAFYDTDRRLIGHIAPDPDGSGSRTPTAVEYTYNVDGVLTKTTVGTVPNQATTLSAFTEAYHSATTLDAYDRPIRQSVVNGSTTYAVSDQLYDSLGRAYCSIRYMNMSAVPGSVPTSCAPTQTTGPYGPDRISQSTYDKDSRVLSTSDGVGTLDTVTYSPNGKQLTDLDGHNNLTTYTYDGFDRLSQTKFPVATQGGDASDASNYEALTYDTDGHVLTKRKRDGNTDTYTYDNLGRVASVALGGGGGTISSTHDLANELTALTNPSGGNVSYVHDALGRLTTETESYGSIASQYDAAGDRTRITWADGFYAGYAYDMIGGVTTINENGATSGVGVLATYIYDNLGRRTAVAYGNGTGCRYAYDGVNRLAGLELAFPSSASNEIIGGVAGLGTPIAYSPSSQIMSVARSNDGYAWTGAHNADGIYTTNGLNQYTNSGGVTIGYDGKGNLTSSGSSSYTYDARNDLATAPNGSMTYDTPGRLQSYTTSSGTLYSYYDGADLVAETNGSSAVNRYVPGPGTDEPIVWYQGSGTSSRMFLQADERGSIVAVTDSSGAVLNINSYDEFGIPASTNSSYMPRYGYTGQTWYPEIGLYNYKARFYSPTLGRFMQADPIGYGDGLNMYNYVDSDPINEIDPSGWAENCSGPVKDGSGDEIVVTACKQKTGSHPPPPYIPPAPPVTGEVPVVPGLQQMTQTTMSKIKKVFSRSYIDQCINSAVTNSQNGVSFNGGESLYEKHATRLAGGLTSKLDQAGGGFNLIQGTQAAVLNILFDLGFYVGSSCPK